MSSNEYFDCEQSNKLWLDYFSEVDKYLSKIPYPQGMAIRQELESHAFESVRESTSGDVLERLKKSLADLGSPKEIVPPMVAEVLISIAQKSNNPVTVFQAVFFQIGYGIRKTALSVFIGLLTIFGGALFIIACVKPFLSENTGLFSDEQGHMHFGIILEAEKWQEHLGFGIIPIALVSSFIFYKLAIWMLKFLK